jgi:hypothetical protein
MVARHARASLKRIGMAGITALQPWKNQVFPVRVPQFLPPILAACGISSWEADATGDARPGARKEAPLGSFFTLHL